MNRIAPLAGAAALVFLPLAGDAATIVGATNLPNLIEFDSSNPAVITRTVPITGLVDQFAGEAVVGLDFRPLNNQLYAWSNAPGGIYRLYALDINTGVAARIGSTDFTFPGATNWAFDFNPTVDRIRIVSDTDVNIRVHPDTGALVATDTNINPSGDIASVAYDRNDLNSGTPTTLFGIDSGSNQLVRIGGVDGNPSPNGGTITNLGPLGVDIIGQGGFDISNEGEAFAALTPQATAPNGTNLYRIDLTTGGATDLGVIGGGSGVRAMAIPVPEPTALVSLMGGSALLCLRRRRAQ